MSLGKNKLLGRCGAKLKTSVRVTGSQAPLGAWPTSVGFGDAGGVACPLQQLCCVVTSSRRLYRQQRRRNDIPSSLQL